MVTSSLSSSWPALACWRLTAVSRSSTTLMMSPPPRLSSELLMSSLISSAGKAALTAFTGGVAVLGAGGGSLMLGGGASQLMTQCIGIVTVGATALVVTSLLWMLVKSVCGLRVTVEEETKGLDTSEHGQVAYVAAQ